MTVPPTRPFAVVTGASSGIGLEIAGELARRGYDLLVCAEDGVALAADALRGNGTAVAELQADLATAEGVVALGDAALATGRPVDVLALNAGVALGGRFVGSDLEEQVRLIRLDVEGVVRLAHRLLPGMVHRGHGRVLVTASTAATMPAPWNATYAAAKAFDHVFALGVRRELRGTGVTVTSLQPGPVRSSIFGRSRMASTLLAHGPRSDPERVARLAVDALLEGRHRVVVGAVGHLQSVAARFLPERARAAVQGVAVRPRAWLAR